MGATIIARNSPPSRNDLCWRQKPARTSSRSLMIIIAATLHGGLTKELLEKAKEAAYRLATRRKLVACRRGRTEGKPLPLLDWKKAEESPRPPPLRPMHLRYVGGNAGTRPPPSRFVVVTQPAARRRRAAGRRSAAAAPPTPTSLQRRREGEQPGASKARVLTAGRPGRRRR